MLCSVSHECIDVFRPYVIAGLKHEIDGGHVERRHPDSLGLNAPRKLWQQALYAFCQARGNGYKRLHGRAGATQVGVVVAVNEWLVVHDGMQGGQESLFYPESLVQQVEYRHDGIRRARSVRNQALCAREVLVIDPIDHSGVHICCAGTWM